MTFPESFHDFGKVNRGEKREHTFHFTNTGTKPVGIDLISSCDCTTATWEEGKRYKPGEKGSIHILFDSTEKEESETVDVDIYTDVRDPETGGPLFYILKYNFELVE